MDIKGYADFSSYIRFEATGDSEADCEYGRVDDHDDDDDDDALSCSYDESDACNASEFNVYDESCHADDDEHGDEKKEDDEKDDGYGASYCCEDDEMQEHQKSYVSSDSSHEFVDEMEKDRLFWEACLAS